MNTPPPEHKNTVKPTLTPTRPKRPRRLVENDQYAKFLQRALRAYTRRIADGDIEALTDLAALTADLEHATGQAVAALHAYGYSWADIAYRLGTTRQAAHQRYGGHQP